MKVAFVILFILIIIALCHCQNPIRLLIGPPMTRAQDYPLMVSIKRRVWGFFFKHTCGGGLLTKKWIASSGFCLEPHRHDVVNLRAYVGGRFFILDSSSQRSTIEEVLIQGRLHSVVGSDKLAFVKTKHELILDGITAKPLPLGEIDTKSYQQLKCTGYMPSWGAISNMFVEYLWRFSFFTLGSPWLKAYEMNVRNCQSETFLQKIQGEDFDDKLCAHTVINQAPCYGDKGSPLVVNGYFVGIYTGPGNCKMSTSQRQNFLTLSSYLQAFRNHEDVELRSVTFHKLGPNCMAVSVPGLFTPPVIPPSSYQSPNFPQNYPTGPNQPVLDPLQNTNQLMSLPNPHDQQPYPSNQYPHDPYGVRSTPDNN